MKSKLMCFGLLLLSLNVVSSTAIANGDCTDCLHVGAGEGDLKGLIWMVDLILVEPLEPGAMREEGTTLASALWRNTDERASPFCSYERELYTLSVEVDAKMHYFFNQDVSGEINPDEIKNYLLGVQRGLQTILNRGWSCSYRGDDNNVTATFHSRGHQSHEEYKSSELYAYDYLFTTHVARLIGYNNGSSSRKLKQSQMLLQKIREIRARYTPDMIRWESVNRLIATLESQLGGLAEASKLCDASEDYCGGINAAHNPASYAFRETFSEYIKTDWDMRMQEQETLYGGEHQQSFGPSNPAWQKAKLIVGGVMIGMGVTAVVVAKKIIMVHSWENALLVGAGGVAVAIAGGAIVLCAPNESHGSTFTFSEQQAWLEEELKERALLLSLVPNNPFAKEQWLVSMEILGKMMRHREEDPEIASSLTAEIAYYQAQNDANRREIFNLSDEQKAQYLNELSLLSQQHNL